MFRTKHLVQRCPKFKHKRKYSLPVTSAHPVLCYFALQKQKGVWLLSVKKTPKQQPSKHLHSPPPTLGFSINSQNIFQSKFSKCGEWTLWCSGMFCAPESHCKMLECNLIWVFKREEERALWNIIWILSLTSWEALWVHLGTVWLLILLYHWIHVESFPFLSLPHRQSRHSWNECSFCCPYARNYANICVSRNVQEGKFLVAGCRARLSNPCLQRVCVQPSALFSHRTLTVGFMFCRFFFSPLFFFFSSFFFNHQMYSFTLAAGFIKKMVSELCGISWVITRNTAVGGWAPSKWLLWVFSGW